MRILTLSFPLAYPLLQLAVKLYLAPSAFRISVLCGITISLLYGSYGINMIHHIHSRFLIRIGSGQSITLHKCIYIGHSSLTTANILFFSNNRQKFQLFNPSINILPKFLRSSIISFCRKEVILFLSQIGSPPDFIDYLLTFRRCYIKRFILTYTTIPQGYDRVSQFVV